MTKYKVVFKHEDAPSYIVVPEGAPYNSMEARILDAAHGHLFPQRSLQGTLAQGYWEVCNDQSPIERYSYLFAEAPRVDTSGY